MTTIAFHIGTSFFVPQKPLHHPSTCLTNPTSCPTTFPRPFMALRRAPRLVTFDIDGTLLASIGPKGNAAHHYAVNSAVNSIFGVDTKVADVPHAGSTDMAIMRRMCTKAGVANSIINEKLTVALAEAASRIDDLIDPNADYSHLVLPGVITILDGLKARGISLALATGNIEKIAWSKLTAAKINHYFFAGGFGDDAEERKDIVAKAIQRTGDGDFQYDQVVHVGDAIADVAISHQLGVDTIGVLTGVFKRSDLEAEKPLIVFDNLSDTDAFFKAIGF